MKDEMEKPVKRMAKNKEPEKNGITVKMLKSRRKAVKLWLTHLHNLPIEENNIPQDQTVRESRSQTK
ncbi:hypothetical protein E2C01_071875 [Portunus trituberculatus]|uniref:Uncharacterized protein n=1 Tax=Portunus trituberculatus TaxID=210409 RepID=A0A5B7I132_PORTR|nr:hypothetical protein [Portunus trituberculatus]